MLPILSTIFLLPLLTSASAPITTHNPSSASIQASLSASSPIQGTITGVTPQNGTGTSFNVNFFDFPTTGAPFSYYISDATSIPGGNCSSLTAVFNPYSASGTCKASDPANCAVGALSAKHASISPTDPTSYSFQAFITDDYLSTAPGTEAYFGGRAIVVADKSGTPVNCGKFPGTPTEEGASSSASASASAAATSSGAAAVVGRVSSGAGGAFIVGVVALMVV